jgi:hypothetical protein
VNFASNQNKIKTMKKRINQLLIISVMFVASCKKKDDPEPQTPLPVTGTVELAGNLSTMSLDASKKYLLKGQVFVNDGVTLTIPAGTVIMGDKATKGTLIINVGGKIMAEGTAAKPIVFTSQLPAGARDKGDWGGLIILGKANVNQNGPSIEGVSPSVSYGTFQSAAHNNDNSGVLKYVRIEYAGIALSPNNETNSVTFGGVGNGTIVENVQVSFGGDDGFEWFGGTVNAKHLISFATWDDDFDTDFGYSGNVQFALAIRDPFAADQSGSNAFESDNDANGNDVMPYTSAVFSNVTVLGPIYDSTKSISGNYQHAMHIRRRSALSVVNSVFTGFTTGFRLDGSSTETQYTSGNGLIANNLMAIISKGTAAPDTVKGGTGNTNASVYSYWRSKNNSVFRPYSVSKNATGYTAAGVDVNLFYGKNTSYPADPNFQSLGVNGASASGADFTDAKLSGAGFFSPTSYRGAFGGSDWTNGWASFNPQNTVY